MNKSDFNKINQDYQDAKQVQYNLLRQSLGPEVKIEVDTMEQDPSSHNHHLLKKRISIDDEESGLDLPVDNVKLVTLGGVALDNDELANHAKSFNQADAAVQQARLDALKEASKKIFDQLGVKGRLGRASHGKSSYTSGGQLKSPYDLSDHRFQGFTFKTKGVEYEADLYAQRNIIDRDGNVFVEPNQVQVSVGAKGKVAPLKDVDMALPLDDHDVKQVVEVFKQEPIVKTALQEQAQEIPR